MCTRSLLRQIGTKKPRGQNSVGSKFRELKEIVFSSTVTPLQLLSCLPPFLVVVFFSLLRLLLLGDTAAQLRAHPNSWPRRGGPPDHEEGWVRGPVPGRFPPPGFTRNSRGGNPPGVQHLSLTIPQTPSRYASTSTVSSSGSSPPRTGAPVFGLLAGGSVATGNSSRSEAFFWWLRGKMRRRMTRMLTDPVLLRESWYLLQQSLAEPHLWARPDLELLQALGSAGVDTSGDSKKPAEIFGDGESGNVARLYALCNKVPSNFCLDNWRVATGCLLSELMQDAASSASATANREAR